MTASMNVTIVRPRATWTRSLGHLVGLVLGYMFTAWILMLLIPHAIDWHPGYWQTYAGVWVVKSLFSDVSYMEWSKGSWE